MTSKPPQLNVRAKALYKFVPENEEELDLNEGDIVIIFEKHEDGWCVGNFDGKVGYFPSAYVEELPPPQPRPVKAAPSTPKLTEAPPLEIKQVGTSENSPVTTPHSARAHLKSADDSGINTRPTGSPRQLPNPGHGTMRKGKLFDISRKIFKLRHNEGWSEYWNLNFNYSHNCDMHGFSLHICDVSI